MPAVYKVYSADSVHTVYSVHNVYRAYTVYSVHNVHCVLKAYTVYIDKCKPFCTASKQCIQGQYTNRIIAIKKVK